MNTRSQFARKRHPIRNLLFAIGLLLGALTAYEYYQHGVVTWHLRLQERVETFYDDVISAGRAADEAPLVVDRSEPLSNDTGVSVTGARNGDSFFETRSASEHRFELVGQVTDVTDGDSFQMRVNELELEIRLHGIDTPEFDQPHGNEASRALSRKIAGQTILVDVVDIDSYDRLVGKVYHDGQNINLEMVQQGHGWWYRQYAGDDRELEQAEEQARDSGLGLWADSDPVPPWEWRR